MNTEEARLPPEVREFLQAIARLKRDGEDGFEMSIDDAFETLDSLIQNARFHLKETP